MNEAVVSSTELPDFPLQARGKVRDIYEIDPKSLLIITTDRMSAFDVILDDPVPYKGVILNQLTLFWMRRFKHLIPNHVLEADVDRYPAVLQARRDVLEGRSVLAKKASPLPVECIVRGYLTGSGWHEYQEQGTVDGIALPAGLEESAKLPEPLFTPSTKAELGEHDQNIDFSQLEKMLGPDLACRLRDISLQLYREAADFAQTRGIIIADTKFEFGMVGNELTLIDEVLTPDSSRFWALDDYNPGAPQASFDKQYLRYWLEAQDWDKKAPAPRLPQDVIQNTSDRYRDAYRLLTGSDIF